MPYGIWELKAKSFNSVNSSEIEESKV